MTKPMRVDINMQMVKIHSKNSRFHAHILIDNLQVKKEKLIPRGLGGIPCPAGMFSFAVVYLSH